MCAMFLGAGRGAVEGRRCGGLECECFAGGWSEGVHHVVTPC